MDAQIKKGILDVCVLAVLKDGDGYGYGIIKKMSDIIEISESTLYPILRRLETAEMLKTYNVETDGRLRKYYSITDKGKERLAQFIEEWKEMNKVFEYIKGERNPN